MSISPCSQIRSEAALYPGAPSGRAHEGRRASQARRQATFLRVSMSPVGLVVVVGVVVGDSLGVRVGVGDGTPADEGSMAAPRSSMPQVPEWVDSVSVTLYVWLPRVTAYVSCAVFVMSPACPVATADATWP